MRPYVIRQGDYLARIAARHAFVAADVWNHPGNAALRRQRASPEILCPGDILQIPDDGTGGIELASHTLNRYRATIPRVEVRVRLQEAGAACVEEAFVVQGADFGREETGTTDGDGCATFHVPITASEVTLRLTRLAIEIPVRVGHLDPSNEASGMRQRLEHLGFCWRAGGATVDDADRARLLLFQRAEGLLETGTYDAATRTALERVHRS